MTWLLKIASHLKLVATEEEKKKIVATLPHET